MTTNDWAEYKNLIIKRLDDISKVEEELVTLKVQMAVLSTKVILITSAIAIGTSALVSAVFTHFLKGGGA